MAPQEKELVRIAAVGDLHCAKPKKGELKPFFAQIADKADILLLAGDLTDYGRPEEAKMLLDELAPIRVPILAVLGNHDHEAGKQDEIMEILSDAGIHMIDGDNCEINGIGFAGVKGFGGGFGDHMLPPWGEQLNKRFVQEALDESLKLETSLARLDTRHRVVLLHYSPIPGTLEGEHPEIFPFLGCSRLEEPILRHPVAAVFHAHAHHGKIEGQTEKGKPVYNVSLSLLKRTFPNRPPFRLLELRVEPEGEARVEKGREEEELEEAAATEQTPG